MGMKINLDKESLILYGVIAGIGFVAVSVALNGAGGTARSVTKGVVGGVLEGVGGALQGAYEALPDPVKPSSDKNVVYQGVNKIGEKISGNKNWTLGGWLYDVLN